MALKNVIVAAAVLASVPVFASSRVDERLSLSAGTSKKTETKSNKARVFDSLNSSETQKTELPKNARYDATAGVFI